MLVPISLLLLLYEAAGIRIDHITVVGNTFTVTNPGFVSISIWLAWLYFLLRYYQYFRDLPDNEFMELWESYTDRYVGRAVRAKFCRTFRREGIPPGRATLRESRVEPVSVGAGDWEFEVIGQISVKTTKGFMHTGVDRERVKLRNVTMGMAKSRALFYVLIHTRVGTEYVLPFAVAGAPLAYGAWDWLRAAA